LTQPRATRLAKVPTGKPLESEAASSSIELQIKAQIVSLPVYKTITSFNFKTLASLIARRHGFYPASRRRSPTSVWAERRKTLRKTHPKGEALCALHEQVCTISKSNAPPNPSICLSEHAAKYSYIRAAFAGAKIILRQVSPEAEYIFDLIIVLFKHCNGDFQSLFSSLGLTIEDLNFFLEYAAMFLDNMGNYRVSPLCPNLTRLLLLNHL
jgi:hypothetical protein